MQQPQSYGILNCFRSSSMPRQERVHGWLNQMSLFFTFLWICTYVCPTYRCAICAYFSKYVFANCLRFDFENIAVATGNDRCASQAGSLFMAFSWEIQSSQNTRKTHIKIGISRGILHLNGIDDIFCFYPGCRQFLALCLLPSSNETKKIQAS